MPISFNVLRIRDFRLMLLTRMLGIMALQAQDVIIGWQVYSITKDPLMLGLVGLTEAIPAIACAFFAGHIVDISRPHRVLLIALAVMAINMGVLLVIAGGWVHFPASVILPWLFIGIFISGMTRSFIMPGSYALLSKVVQRSELGAAAAWLSSGFQIAAIGGPALAGLIYGFGGAHIAWLLPVILMSTAWIMIANISAGPRAYRGSERREPVAQSIKAGWRYIFNTPVLLSVMVLDMFAVLFGGAIAMLPAYADQVLHVGSEGLGALRAAPAIGAVAMALILAVRPMKQIRAVNLLWAITGFGFCIIGFGLSTNFYLSMLFLFFSGLCDSVSVVTRSTLMQWLTPDAMRGRVASVNSMFIVSSNEIGAFESGVAARLIGLVPSVVLGGVATLLIVTTTALLSPKMRRAVVDADTLEKK